MQTLTAVHDSQQLLYKAPFGAVRCGEEIKLRLKILGPVEGVACQVCLREGEKQEVYLPMEPMVPKGEETWYEASWTMQSTPGLQWYFFRIISGSEIYYYGNNAGGLGGEGQLMNSKPIAYQITVYREAIVPSWYKEGIVYQIYVDRFYNGMPHGQILHPKKNSFIHGNWDDAPFYVKDQEGRILRWTFFGGNLQGIIAKLPYLEELGVTILYLNPIFLAPSNHKYDTADYHAIDPMYGDEDTLTCLVQAAGKCGISIILDGVFAHVGSDSLYFNRYGNHKGIGAYQSETSPFSSWFEKGDSGEGFRYWWGVEDLPKVRAMEDSYRAFLFGGKNSVIDHWMSHGIKGWRLDVADELPDEFLQELRQAVKEKDPESVLIGEVWEDASNKVSYGKRRRYFSGDALDGVTNYPWRAILLDFLLGKTSARDAGLRLMSLFENYPPENFRASLNLIGSHDRMRILTVLGEAPPPESISEEEKAYYRLDAEKREKAMKRLQLLTLLQMTFPGVPCLYYGDEAGLEGYDDPYNRGTYPWDREDKTLLAWYQKVLRLRQAYPIIHQGVWRPFNQGNEVLGIRIQHEGEELLVFINRSVQESVPVQFELPGEYLWDLLAGEKVPIEERPKYSNEKAHSSSLALPPLSGRLLYSLKNNPYRPMKRACGILLHPTSLPSPWGIGDLGEPAEQFLDFLAASGHHLWQLLPLNPTGPGNSPYSSGSVFAGNWLLISVEKLMKQGLLEAEELKMAMTEYPADPSDQVDFDRAAQQKQPLLSSACKRFYERRGEEQDDFLAFLAENRFWLEDHVRYQTHQAHSQWSCREQEGMAYHRFLQYVFFSQWAALKEYANRRSIQIIGDMPFYTAAEGADVMAHPEWFKLTADGRPSAVSGVPPDCFNPEGQLWGTPVYHWRNMKHDGFIWWIERLRHMLRLYDRIRVDHFRGFEAFWEVPVEATTAAEGRWLQGPGLQLFHALQEALGTLPLIAEDLGYITPEVHNLRNLLGYPGMKVYQFDALKECINSDDMQQNVFYSGTHDNETLLEWMLKNRGSASCSPECLRTAAWTILQEIYDDSANWVIIPLQDMLGLGREARMNRPGTNHDNWRWRLKTQALTDELSLKMRNMAAASNRDSKERDGR